MVAMTTITSPFTGSYVVDTDHSSFGFAVRHMGVSMFWGAFRDVAESAPEADAAFDAGGGLRSGELDSALGELVGALRGRVERSSTKAWQRSGGWRTTECWLRVAL